MGVMRCLFCDQECEDTHDLLNHLLDDHGEVQAGRFLLWKGQAYLFCFCGEGFTTRYSMASHIDANGGLEAHMLGLLLAGDGGQH